jgi:hypothetical protein
VKSCVLWDILVCSYWKSVDISEKYIASIFRLSLLPADGGFIFLRNVGSPYEWSTWRYTVSQKTGLFITTVVRTSDPTCNVNIYSNCHMTRSWLIHGPWAESCLWCWQRKCRSVCHAAKIFQRQISRQVIFPHQPDLFIMPAAKIVIWWVTVFRTSVHIITGLVTQHNSFCIYFFDNMWGISCFWITGYADHKNANNKIVTNLVFFVIPNILLWVRNCRKGVGGREKTVVYSCTSCSVLRPQKETQWMVGMWCSMLPHYLPAAVFPLAYIKPKH